MDTMGFLIFQIMSAVVQDRFNAVMDSAFMNVVNGVLAIGTVTLTVWLAVMGLKIATRANGPSISQVFWKVAFAAVVFGAINASIAFNTLIQDWIFGFRDDIVSSITDDARSGNAQISGGLQILNLADQLSDLLEPDTGATPSTSSLTLMAAIVGQGSPAIVGGILLLLNEIILRAGITLAPIFLFLFLFDSTKDLFNGWIRLVFITIFQMAFLAVTVRIAADIAVIFTATLTGLRVAAAAGIATGPLTQLQMSLMQAGFGIMLSALIYSVPQAAARFLGWGTGISPNSIFGNYRPSAPPGSMSPPGVSMPAANTPPPVVVPNSTPSAGSINPGSYTGTGTLPSGNPTMPAQWGSSIPTMPPPPPAPMVPPVSAPQTSTSSRSSERGAS